MKSIKVYILPLSVLAAGVVGFLLRVWLFTAGVDAKGLLAANHPAGIASFILFALVIAGLFWFIRPLHPISKYTRLFPASIVSAVGCALGAAGIVVTVFRMLATSRSFLSIACLVLGILAAAALLVLAYHRWKGLQPTFALQAVLTVFLMLYLISRYQAWSAEPQLQLYFFSFLAVVFLMLTAYHGTLLDARKSGRRWYVFCNQAAVFCCCMSLTDANWLFYLTMALWAASNLCSLQVRKSRPVRTEEA